MDQAISSGMMTDAEVAEASSTPSGCDDCNCGPPLATAKLVPFLFLRLCPDLFIFCINVVADLDVTTAGETLGRFMRLSCLNTTNFSLSFASMLFFCSSTLIDFRKKTSRYRQERWRARERGSYMISTRRGMFGDRLSDSPRQGCKPSPSPTRDSSPLIKLGLLDIYG